MNNGRGNIGATQAQEDFLIVNQTAAGFRVYPASSPTSQQVVREEANRFHCDCEEFAVDGTCEHIRAVIDQLSSDKRIEEEERKAIEEEGQGVETYRGKSRVPMLPATMSLKRSISPDGRIDSLSVEFCCSVEQVPSGEITNRAANMLKLQSDIATSFLSKNSNGSHHNGNGNGRPNLPSKNGAVHATMLHIGSVNGRYGPRLFIAFKANGQSLKLFGTARQLADAITSAGYRYGPEDIGEGIELNLPCQVVTKPGRDPRYTDIDRVLPTQPASNSLRR